MFVFTKKLNKYTQNFIAELHSAINESMFVNPSYINDKDYIVIDDAVGRYYPKIFWTFYRENKELIHYPDRAIDFNSTLILLFMEAVRLVYVVIPSYSTIEKEIYLESLIRYIDKRVSSIESNELANVELINNIKDEIFEEYERILKQHNENVSDLKQNCLQKTEEYCKRKLNETLNLVVSHIPEDDVIDSKKFARVIIFNAVIGIILPFFLNFLHINHKTAYIIYTVYLSLLILISLVFPLYVADVGKKFKKIMLLNKPYDFYSRLGVDVITIYVADNQLPYADPEEKNILLPIIADTRMQITDEYGFVMSGVRVLDNQQLENGYTILFRNNEVCHLDLDISKNIIYKKDVEKYGIQLPEGITEYGVNGEIYYQAEQKFCDSLSKEAYITGAEFFKNTFKSMVLSHLDILFTIEETVALFDLYKSYLSSQNISLEQIKPLNDKLDVYDLREIFIQILKKGESLVDLPYVFHQIIKHSKTSSDVNYVAYQVCKDLESIHKKA